MDNIDLEIRDLENMWADQERDRLRRAAEAQEKFLEMRRATLRDGTWKPRHACKDCLRAILSMSPDLCCAEGKKTGDQWWVRP
jgi:hypothetical protein